jgi:hypothetical protein
MGKLSDEELIDILHNTDNPKCTEFGPKFGKPSYKTYERRFGSWNKAMELAGKVVYKKSLSDQQLLDILKDAEDTREVAFSPGNDRPSYLTYIKRFGSWNEALRLAGRDKNLGGFDSTKPTIVYLVYFIAEDIYKVGITQRSISQRFTSYPEYNVILYHEIDDLEEAKSLERTWLDNVKSLKHTAVSFSGGRTECFKYL